MTLATLIKEAKDGSNTAQEALFNGLSEWMFRLCLRYVKNEQDAEERMQDGFYKFFTSLSSFTYVSDANLHAWLKSIMIRECLLQLRKKNVFTIIAESNAEDIPVTKDALDNLSAAEITHLINSLPVGYRTVFNLNMVEGMEHKEIAGLLGISEGTSWSQLSKAKCLLQKMLLSKNNDYVRYTSTK